MVAQEDRGVRCLHDVDSVHGFMERVLDTAALLHWPPDRLNDGVCAPSQRVELERLSPARAMLVEAVNIEWRPVSKAAMEQAVAAATVSGDLPRLSDVDLDVLALALEANAVLYTDDYRMQNTHKLAGGAVEAVVNVASKHVWIWEQRCTGCGAVSAVDGEVKRSKHDVVGECRVCGSALKVKRRRG